MPVENFVRFDRERLTPILDRGDLEVKIAMCTHLRRLSQLTFVPRALANGASPRDVQAIVGHSNPSLTMRICAQATNQGRRAAVDGLPFAMSTPALRIASGD